MNAIRRVKLSENSYVTPVEFRYTLIKFGVTLPQAIVDAVFNVFDRYHIYSFIYNCQSDLSNALLIIETNKQTNKN
jgi:hypothetical protein